MLDSMNTEKEPPVHIVADELGRNDEAVLAEQGKKQVLKRNFSFVSMLAFTATSMCTVLI